MNGREAGRSALANRQNVCVLDGTARYHDRSPIAPVASRQSEANPECGSDRHVAIAPRDDNGGDPYEETFIRGGVVAGGCETSTMNG